MTEFDVSPSRASRQIDDHVGARIRLRRTMMGMTQEQLAALLGISYQQVQKYETGTNRVSAGRLFEISQKLGTEIAFFFEKLDPSAERKELPHGGRNRIAIDLVRNFLDIHDEDMRQALANLVKVLKGHLCPPGVTVAETPTACQAVAIS